jgi:hypothetical protein
MISSKSSSSKSSSSKSSSSKSSSSNSGSVLRGFSYKFNDDILDKIKTHLSVDEFTTMIDDKNQSRKTKKFKYNKKDLDSFLKTFTNKEIVSDNDYGRQISILNDSIYDIISLCVEINEFEKTNEKILKRYYDILEYCANERPFDETKSEFDIRQEFFQCIIEIVSDIIQYKFENTYSYKLPTEYCQKFIKPMNGDFNDFCKIINQYIRFYTLTLHYYEQQSQKLYVRMELGHAGQRINFGNKLMEFFSDCINDLTEKVLKSSFFKDINEKDAKRFLSSYFILLPTLRPPDKYILYCYYTDTFRGTGTTTCKFIGNKKTRDLLLKIDDKFKESSSAGFKSHLTKDQINHMNILFPSKWSKISSYKKYYDVDGGYTNIVQLKQVPFAM